jgi:Nitroreductase family
VQTWEAIRSRRNVRSFEDRAIPGDHLGEICQAGRRAPSPQNRQPRDFVVVTAVPEAPVTVPVAVAYGPGGVNAACTG